MEDLIKALQILLKYGNPEHPFRCNHAVFYIEGIKPEDISKQDRIELEKLGFIIRVEGEYNEEEDDVFYESEIYFLNRY